MAAVAAGMVAVAVAVTAAAAEEEEEEEGATAAVTQRAASATVGAWSRTGPFPGPRQNHWGVAETVRVQ